MISETDPKLHAEFIRRKEMRIIQNKRKHEQDEKALKTPVIYRYGRRYFREDLIKVRE